MLSEGTVNTTSSHAACLLGLDKRSVQFTPVTWIAQKTDFKTRLPMDQWWLKLRPLLRILAKHKSVYMADSQGILPSMEEVENRSKLSFQGSTASTGTNFPPALTPSGFLSTNFDSR